MNETLNKYIYESTVKKVIQDTKLESREENGQTVTVSTPIETQKDIKIAILKPNRKKFKEAEIFYAITLSNYLRQGLLSYSLVSKRYANDGGPLSDNEQKAINTMRDKYSTLHSEYFEMKEPISDDNKVRRTAIIFEMNQITTALKEFENACSKLFENTAEIKANNDTREFWILTCSYIDEDGKGYKCFYGDGNLESKADILESLEDKEDQFTNEVIRKLSYLISFWFTVGPGCTSENFKSAENDYEQNVTDYLKPKELEDTKSNEGFIPNTTAVSLNTEKVS